MNDEQGNEFKGLQEYPPEGTCFRRLGACGHTEAYLSYAICSSDVIFFGISKIGQIIKIWGQFIEIRYFGHFTSPEARNLKACGTHLKHTII
jgi:hypothetical protein